MTPRFESRPFERDAWNALVSEYPGYSLIQSWEWGEAKAHGGPWRVERGVFLDEDGKTMGAAQVLLRPLPGPVPGGLAWVNRAPLGDAPEPLLPALRDHYVTKRGYYLRAAPISETVPDGFAPAGADGWASGIIDLEMPLDDLRKALRGNWRNALNKAEKLGLDVLAGEDGEAFEGFLDGQARFVEARGFATTVTVALLRVLQETLKGGRPMRAYLAKRDGAAIGGALVARYGDGCEYLAGFSDDAGRKASVGQLLLWRAIADMKDEGRKRFDVGGMDPNLTPKGILQFKQGTGAESYRLPPELESLRGPIARLVRWRVNRAREG